MNPKLKDAFLASFVFLAAPFWTWQVYIDSPLMDCAYLKSSDTNISDYFDSSKSCWKFLNNRVKVPLMSDFPSVVTPIND